MMTLASEVRDLRALVVETSVRTVEETRAAAASAETSGREEREKLTSTLTEKTLECEKLRRERDSIVADAKCEASGAVRAMREELESLRARAGARRTLRQRAGTEEQRAGRVGRTRRPRDGRAQEDFRGRSRSRAVSRVFTLENVAVARYADVGADVSAIGDEPLARAVV